MLIRPVCGCCGNPMILGRSVGKYQSFFCFSANTGIRGCTNRGSKSARIIDEAVLGTVMATLFTVLAKAVLERGRPTDRDGAPVPVWDSIHASPNPGAATTAGPAEVIVPLIYDRRAAARNAAKKRGGAA